jgi:aerobic carbon-monoxide dehydrogenase small subunit
MSDKSDIALDINGRRYDLTIEARRLLADVIRDDCGLTGTHLGCEHGVCGACTVLVEGEPIRSCLMFAVQANGKKIRTVEGLAPQGALHPLQSAFIAEHGLQCGFCTPGMMLTARWLLDHNPDPSEAEIRAAISGQACRCTGYENIVRSIRWAAEHESSPQVPA